MSKNSQIIYDDIYDFSTFNISQDDYIKIYLKIMENIYEESKVYLFILKGTLLSFSIVGTISNLFTFFIFQFIFNKNFNRKIQSNLAAAAVSIKKKATQKRLISKNNEEVDYKRSEVIFNHYYEDEGDNKAIKLHVSFNKVKKKLIFSSNLKVFYTLIRYLTAVDLFTCSVAIPATVYEIWNNLNLCVLLEFYYPIF